MRGVQIDSRFLHLDMAFNVVAEKVAVAATAALPDPFIRLLSKRRFDIVDVPLEGVLKHRCNVQALGDGRVLSFTANRVVNERMRTLGLDVVCVELEHVLKGGGGPHCMTFPLARGV